MSFPPYSAYKPSGVEWLGEVPEHWEVKRIASLYREVVEQGSDELPVLSVSIHHGVSDSELSEEEMDRKVTRSEDRSKYKRVSAGDLVYNMMRAWQGAFGTVCVEGMVSPAYVVARPTSIVPSTWIEYLLRTDPAINEIKRFSRGITDFRLRLYWDEFKNLRVCLPPCNERDALLEFLDHETAKIDALIAEQQRLIELLQEKRQAVISHAVTKGLNPDAPMKDSGVEWLGEVPEHWEVMPLKRIVAMQSGNSITAETIESAGAYPVYGGNGLRGYTSSFTHSGEFVLIGRQGALCGNINYATGRFFASEHAVVATARKSVDVTWLGEMMRTMNLNQYSVSAAQPGLSVELIGNVRTIYAPLEEQRRLAGFLSDQSETLAGLSTEAFKAIDLLQERRSALISAAVTGRIDVRGLVPEVSE